MARQRRHKPYRSRRGRFGPLAKLLSVLAVAAAVAVACVVFFRVNQIEVVGNQRYSAGEIIDASGIRIGDNLIMLPRSRVVASILTELPYVEAVTPQRVLPDGVILRVRERSAAASVDSGEGRWLISSQGKLLEQEGDGAQAMRITGLTALAPYAGGELGVAEEEQATLDYVLELLAALEENGMLEGCTSLDCTGPADMMLEYSIYHVRLPRGGDYGYLIELLQAALNDERMPKDTPGTADLTVKEGKVYFSRDK